MLISVQGRWLSPFPLKLPALYPKWSMLDQSINTLLRCCQLLSSVLVSTSKDSNLEKLSTVWSIVRGHTSSIENHLVIYIISYIPSYSCWTISWCIQGESMTVFLKMDGRCVGQTLGVVYASITEDAQVQICIERSLRPLNKDAGF